MATETTPYVKRDPGDLITAEDWNDLQKKIKGDLATINEAINKLKTEPVPNADNAHKLDGKDLDALKQAFLEEALKLLPKRTGYKMLFKNLTAGKANIIEHKLGGELKAFPLVDIYYLEPFQVVCSERHQENAEYVRFYLYHGSEHKIRVQDSTYSIEPAGEPKYRVLFKDMLELYYPEYKQETLLRGLVTEFWEHFCDANDEFDSSDFCHSPWFEECCREEKPIAGIDWDDLWLKMILVNPLRGSAAINYINNDNNLASEDIRIKIKHINFDTLGIDLGFNSNSIKVPVMMLLKV